MKKILVCVLVLSLCGFAVGCTQPASNDGDTSGNETVQQYRIGTASTTGAYYPIGGMMASLLSQNMEGYNFTAESTGGTIENARRVNAGEIQVATFANDGLFFAYNGVDKFEGEGKQEVVAFANLYNTPYQIVTLKGSGINTISDLKGKRVSVGSPGSGNNIKAKLFLDAFGFEDGVNVTYQYLDWGEASDGLVDGTCDVGMIAVGLPAASIQELAASHDIQLVSFTPDELAMLTQEVPFFSETVVPAGTYTGVDYDVLTFGCGNTIGISPSLDEDTVYNMAKVLFGEFFEDFQSSHQAMQAVTKEQLPNTVIPLHSGAEKYYKEMGYID